MKRLTAITRPFTAAAGAPVRPAKAALNYLAVCVAVIAVVWASLAAAGISLNFDFVAQYRVYTRKSSRCRCRRTRRMVTGLSSFR